MHEEWTDHLSDYLDGELPPGERDAVEAHLSGCPHCAAVLADLKRVVARAQAAGSPGNNVVRPPQTDLWPGIAARIDERRSAKVAPFVAALRRPFGGASASRRISFTMAQALAASLLIALLSGGLAWQTAERLAGRPAEGQRSAEASRSIGSASAERETSMEREALAERTPPADDVHLATVSFADPQYDAAVADLEKAVKLGRGRLDKSTIAIVEHNLQIIDQAIEQARLALASDPANSYLSSHLFEARRRKLDLLRRTAALTTEMD